MDNLSDPESAEEDTELSNGSVEHKEHNGETEETQAKKAIEEVVTEGEAKVELFAGDYPEEYEEYQQEGSYHGSYQEDGFVPDEAEYYQREYTYKAERKGSPTEKKNKSKPLPTQNSLFLFSHTNRSVWSHLTDKLSPAKPGSLFRFRLRCHWLCNHPYFGNLVLLCILVSSVMLAAEDPLNSNSERNKVSTTRLTESAPRENIFVFSDSELF